MYPGERPSTQPPPVHTPPIGEICVLRDELADAWTVAICRGGTGQRDVLARFTDREKAAQFALEERDRRLESDEMNLAIHFPDDCPCGKTCRR